MKVIIAPTLIAFMLAEVQTASGASQYSSMAQYLSQYTCSTYGKSSSTGAKNEVSGFIFYGGDDVTSTEMAYFWTGNNQCAGVETSNFKKVTAVESAYCSDSVPDFHNVSFSTPEYAVVEQSKQLVSTYNEIHINDSTEEDVSNFQYMETRSTTQSASLTQSTELMIGYEIEVGFMGTSSKFSTSYTMSSEKTQSQEKSVAYDVTLSQEIHIAAKSCTVYTLNIYETVESMTWSSLVTLNGMFIDSYNSDEIYFSGLGMQQGNCFWAELDAITAADVKGSLYGATGFSVELVKTEYALSYDNETDMATCDYTTRKTTETSTPTLLPSLGMGQFNNVGAKRALRQQMAR